jgi:hypothetical protein
MNYYQNSYGWWVVMASINNKQYCLGAFKTSQEAREYCITML